MGTRKVSRRGVIATALAASVASQVQGEERKVSKAATWDSVVVGAGVFGAWTAWHLRKAGQRVLLLDAFGAAHARASSGGESRLTRGSYGRDEIYTRFAFDSLPQWKWLSDLSGLPILHQIGVLFFFQKREAYVDQSLEVHRRLKLPTHRARSRRAGAALSAGVLERHRGGTARARVRRAHGAPRRADARQAIREGRWRVSRRGSEATRCVQGADVGASFRMARRCPRLTTYSPAGRGCRRCSRICSGRASFPRARKCFSSRRPRAMRASAPAPCPAGPISTMATSSTACPISRAAASRSLTTSMARRSIRIAAIASRHRARWPMRALTSRSDFPRLPERRSTKSACASTRTARNGDLLIDRHPTASNVLLVGAGSGHGFKHGPEVGRYASELLTGKLKKAEPRFSLATKAEQQNRAVH